MQEPKEEPERHHQGAWRSRAANPFAWLKYLVDTIFHVLGHMENLVTLAWNAFVLVVLVGLVYVLYQKVTGQMLPGGEAVVDLYNVVIEKSTEVIMFIVNRLNG
ncbi:MAG: hypothetical protein K6T65_10380 [Peptococcaceae bacterium]|nr:hypothetical protein [Peptococcaceae bacterium]